MGSVDRSANKRCLHKIPSRLTIGSTGLPRAAMDAGETKGGCLEQQMVRHTAFRLTGTASPNAARRGRDDSAWNWRNKPGTINWRPGPRGKPREPAKTGRSALGSGRGDEG